MSETPKTDEVFFNACEKGKLTTEGLGRLLDHARELERQIQQWQPISTAPKDGTEILVETDRSKRRIAAYGKYCDLWMDCTNGSSIKPVRWMPLPPVPTKEADPLG